MKREPILADHVLNLDRSRVSADPKWIEQGLDNLRTCKKFVLDSQAALYVAQMIKEDPRVVADAQDFAIPPFQKMWIEFPYPAFYEHMTGHPTDATGDLIVGYLFDGPVVRVCSQGYDKHSGRRVSGGFGMAEYILNRPMSPQYEVALCEKIGISRLGLNLWFWGESASAFTGQHLYGELDEQNSETWDKAGLRALRDNHTARLIPLKKEIEEFNLFPFKGVVDGSAGDLRNIIALLLFLDRTRDIQTVKDWGPKQGFISSKLKPFVSHSVISLKLDPLPMLRKLSAGEGIRRRLHDVRGNFKHDPVAKAGCLHGAASEDTKDWGDKWVEQPAPANVLRWKCSLCGGKRWWQPEHKRGHFEEGVVLQQYAVTR